MLSNFFQNLHIIYATNENFRDDIKYIRENVTVINSFNAEKDLKDDSGELGFGKILKTIKIPLNINQLINNYNKVVSDLRLKYHLSSAYHNVVKDLIEEEEDSRFTDLSTELWPFNVASPSNPKEKFTVIRLSPETTITELQKNWNKIRQAVVRLSDSKPPKASPRVNVARDLEIYQLRQNGKKDKEIASIINEKYPDKILGYQDIAKIVKRLLDYSKKLTGQAK